MQLSNHRNEQHAEANNLGYCLIDSFTAVLDRGQIHEKLRLLSLSSSGDLIGDFTLRHGESLAGNHGLRPML